MGDPRSGCVPELPTYIYGMIRYKVRRFLRRIYQAPDTAYHRLRTLQSIIGRFGQHIDQYSSSLSRLRFILSLSHTTLRRSKIYALEISGACKATFKNSQTPSIIKAFVQAILEIFRT